MSTAIGFMGCVAVLILAGGDSAFGGIATLVSLSEPQCLVLTGVGFLLVPRVCTRWTRRTDPVLAQLVVALIAVALTRARAVRRSVG